MTNTEKQAPVPRTRKWSKKRAELLPGTKELQDAMYTPYLTASSFRTSELLLTSPARLFSVPPYSDYTSVILSRPLAYSDQSGHLITGWIDSLTA